MLPIFLIWGNHLKHLNCMFWQHEPLKSVFCLYWNWSWKFFVPELFITSKTPTDLREYPSWICVMYFSLHRPADLVCCEPLYHLLIPGHGWDGEAGRPGGSGLHPHLLRLVSRSGLALLWPGAHQRRTAVYSSRNSQAAAQQSQHGLTETSTVDVPHAGWLTELNLCECSTKKSQVCCCNVNLPEDKVTHNSKMVKQDNVLKMY